jgi:hypothetical protein
MGENRVKLLLEKVDKMCRWPIEKLVHPLCDLIKVY